VKHGKSSHVTVDVEELLIRLAKVMIVDGQPARTVNAYLLVMGHWLLEDVGFDNKLFVAWCDEVVEILQRALNPVQSTPHQPTTPTGGP
jgi:hypothetical protein